MSTSFQLFNLQTMSGVFPGTRTMVFQRVRVQLLEQGDETPGAAQWVRLLWYEDPAACAVELGANLLRIPQPLSGDFGEKLAEALAANGLRYMTCGSCAFWQVAAAKTADGLPAGRSTCWRAGGPVAAGAGLQLLGTGWEQERCTITATTSTNGRARRTDANCEACRA